jgi:hypothetical protein
MTPSGAGNRGLGGSLACRRAMVEALSGSNLSGPNLSGSNLSGSNWSAATRAHLDGCASCAGHVRARDALLPALRSVPPFPAGVRPGELLAAVRERIVESAETSALGQRLVAVLSAPVPLPEAGSAGLPEVLPALLESEVAERTVRAADSPGSVAWMRLQRAIAADARRAPMLRRVGRWAVAGVAAAVIAGLILISEGTSAPPRIVFADIDQAPDIDFAVLRRGAPR